MISGDIDTSLDGNTFRNVKTIKDKPKTEITMQTTKVSALTDLINKYGLVIHIGIAEIKILVSQDILSVQEE